MDNIFKPNIKHNLFEECAKKIFIRIIHIDLRFVKMKKRKKEKRRS